MHVLAHRETPGLGDLVESSKSDWVRQFDGRSLGDPAVEDWRIERDGGAFDQLTGASIQTSKPDFVNVFPSVLEWVTRSAEAGKPWVVSCDEPTSLADAYALIKLLNREHGVFRFRVLVNMASSAQQAREVYEKITKVTDRFLDVALDYMGHVPRDDYLIKAVRKQRAVVEAFPRSRAATAFRTIADRVNKWPIPHAAGGHLEFFVERLVHGNLHDAEVMP